MAIRWKDLELNELDEVMSKIEKFKEEEENYDIEEYENGKQITFKINDMEISFVRIDS